MHFPTFERYRVLREVGRGAMGVVYEAEHLGLRRRVALKVLHLPLRGNATAEERLAREGQVAARLRHPHVIDVTDSGTCEAGPFLAMEFVDGPTLAAHLREVGPMSPEQALRLVLPVVSALAHAHAAGIVHRDVKPANILLSRDPFGDPCPKVGDFGIGKWLDEERSRSLTKDGLVGSLPYMAPEQVREARTVDARADQYSLAVVLYEACSGRLPFAAAGSFALMEAICSGGAPSLSDVAPGVPLALAEVTRRALSVRPEDRYPSMTALGAKLLRFASGRTWSHWSREFTGGEPVEDGGTLDGHVPSAGMRADGGRSRPGSRWRRIVLPLACLTAGAAGSALGWPLVRGAEATVASCPSQGTSPPPPGAAQMQPLAAAGEPPDESSEPPQTRPPAASTPSASAPPRNSRPQPPPVKGTTEPRTHVEFGQNQSPILE